jgi:predicted Zn-dependent peptidase
MNELSGVDVTTLPNGLRVVSEHMPRLESAAVGVWVDAGARYESAEINGIAHMLEHMAFKGTERRSAYAIAEEVEAVGGHMNAYTSREQTAYFIRVLKGDVPLAVDILADILQHSTFDAGELERERSVIIQEIGQTEDTPDDIVFDHLQAAAFPDQPVGRSILGSIENVSGMGRETLADFMTQHYQASKLILCAAGAVDHQNLVNLAREHFGDVGQGDAPGYDQANYKGHEKRDQRQLEQVHFALGLPGIAYNDDDFYACQVMSTILGGGMSSRLFQEVREKRGLCYSVFSFASSFHDGGLFGVYAGTGEDQVAELVPVMCDVLTGLAGDLRDEEVTRARTQLKAGLLMSLETPGARSEQIARQMMIHGRPLSTQEIVDQVDAVDAVAVKRIVSRICSAGKPTIAAVGPLKGLASHDKIAAQFG